MQRINRVRYILLMLCMGIALGIAVHLIKRLLILFSIELAPFALGGGIVGAGLVVAMVIINRLIRNGRCKWLLKRKD